MSYTRDQLKDKFTDLFSEENLCTEEGGLLDSVNLFSSDDNVLVFCPTSKDLRMSLEDPDLLDHILDNPLDCFEVIKEVIEENGYKSHFDYEEEDPIEIGIKDLSDPHIKTVRELREEDIGKYIGVKGVVRRVSDILPLAKTIPFECNRCGTTTYQEQREDGKMEEPVECSGCGKSSRKINFIGKPSKSEYEDYQELKIAERQRDLKAGEQPRDKKAILRNHLVDQIKSSDEVILYGIYKARFKKDSTIPETYLDVKHIEVLSKDFSEVELEPEEEKRVEELAKDPDIFEKIVGSIAPSIKGLRKEKESIALQLFGGVRKKHEDNRHRGDIHILLAGDPETGKSQVLDYVSQIAPKGILGSGRGASGVGLTASLSQEEIAGESHWVCDPGILPLADKGLAAIDEFDKMRSEDRDTIHRALTQQDIRVDKANIHQILNSRCPVLAAANPELGRFDESDLKNPEKKLIEEINIKPDLRSRFDYIWIITGRRKKEELEEITDHITKLHKELGKREKDPDHNHNEEINPPLDKKELKSYIKKAKELIPTWREGPREEIKDYFSKLSENTEVGWRTLEGLIRSAEASARLHFREEVKMEDVNLAISLKEEELKRAKEIDLLHTGYTQKERTLLKEVRDIIRGLEDKYPSGVPKETILDRAENNGYDREEIRREIERMKDQGQIMEPKRGGYRLV